MKCSDLDYIDLLLSLHESNPLRPPPAAGPLPGFFMILKKWRFIVIFLLKKIKLECWYRWDFFDPPKIFLIYLGKLMLSSDIFIFLFIAFSELFTLPWSKGSTRTCTLSSAWPRTPWVSGQLVRMTSTPSIPARQSKSTTRYSFKIQWCLIIRVKKRN